MLAPPAEVCGTASESSSTHASMTPAAGYDAKSLAGAIESAGGAVSSILDWNAGAQVFIPWDAINPHNNPFDIDQASAYFVRITTLIPAPFRP